MGKTPDLPDLEKGMVIGYWGRGASMSETAECVECSHVPGVKVYHEWMNGTVLMTQHANCGTPCVTDTRDKCQLWQLVRIDWCAATDQVAMQMNSGVTRHVSNMTVQKTLLCMIFWSRYLVTAPMRTANHRTECHQFAQPYWHWPLPNGNRLPSQKSRVFCSTGWTEVGVSGKKPTRTKTLQQLLAEYRLVAAVLLSGECFPGNAWVCMYIWRALSTNVVTYLSSQIWYPHTCWLCWG